MSTATATSLSELVAQSEQLKAEYQSKIGPIMAQIRDKAAAEAGDFSVGNIGSAKTSVPTSVPTSAPTSAPKRGRPKAGRPKAESAETTAVPKSKGRGRPKGSKNKSSSVKPNERNYDNKISLRQAIWQVLDQGPDQWAKHLPDLPEDAEGLKASETREIIDITGIWESASENISNQVTQHLHKLKKDGKIARGKDRRYYIVEGAEL